jgi:hypothetical protein
MTPKTKRTGTLGLSKNQYGALRFVDTHTVNLEHLESFKDTTIYWLLRRGYFILTQSDELLLSPAGAEALNSYRDAEMPWRKTESDITERSRIELSAARAKAKKIKAVA